MAGLAPAGFGEALGLKYNIEQTRAQNEGALQRAQAEAIPTTTQSEAQLRAAQAFQAEQAGELAPQALEVERQRAATEAREAGARGRLYGAQSTDILHDLNPADPNALLNFRRAVSSPYGAGAGGQSIGAGGAPVTTYNVTGKGTQDNQGGFLDNFLSPHGRVGFAEGTSDVSVMGGFSGAGYQDSGGGYSGTIADPTAVRPHTFTPPPGQLGLKGGSTKVPGKGSGKVDTVPAMLAPGEAVLNKGAAEHMGRDKIAALNMIGQVKMGMVGKGDSKPAQEAKAQSNGKGPANKTNRPGFAGGTPNVTPGPYLTSPRPTMPPGSGANAPWGNQGQSGSAIPAYLGRGPARPQVQAAKGLARVPGRGGMPKKGPGLTTAALQQAMASMGGGGGAAGPMPTPAPPLMGRK